MRVSELVRALKETMVGGEDREVTILGSYGSEGRVIEVILDPLKDRGYIFLLSDIRLE